MQQLGDVVDRERRNAPPPERRYQVAVELVAVRLERTRVTLAGGDLRLEALNPPAGDRIEAKPPRDPHLPGTGRRDQRQPLTPRRGEVEANRAEAQPACVAPADRVLAVRLAVDAALDPECGRGRSIPSQSSLPGIANPCRERRLLTRS